jgi:hypothetical protein
MSVCSAGNAVDIDPDVSWLDTQQDIAAPPRRPGSHGPPIGGDILGTHIIGVHRIEHGNRVDGSVKADVVPVTVELPPGVRVAGRDRRGRGG